MTYYAHLTQEGEGCDYTIGCANTLITIEAENDEDAKTKLAEEIRENYYADTQLSDVKLFKDPINFDLNEVYTTMNDENETRKSGLQHIKDMDEFERLRAKLGK